MPHRLQTSDFRLSPPRGLNPHRTFLENGATLLVKQTQATPSVTISLAVRAGSACDPDGAPGTTWLLSRVIDRGTATQSAAVIAEELDSRGITVSVTLTRHLFTVVCTCLSDDFERVDFSRGFDRGCQVLTPCSAVSTARRFSMRGQLASASRGSKP